MRHDGGTVVYVYVSEFYRDGDTIFLFGILRDTDTSYGVVIRLDYIFGVGRPTFNARDGRCN